MVFKKHAGVTSKHDKKWAHVLDDMCTNYPGKKIQM